MKESTRVPKNNLIIKDNNGKILISEITSIQILYGRAVVVTDDDEIVTLKVCNTIDEAMVLYNEVYNKACRANGEYLGNYIVD